MNEKRQQQQENVMVLVVKGNQKRPNPFLLYYQLLRAGVAIYVFSLKFTKIKSCGHCLILL